MSESESTYTGLTMCPNPTCGFEYDATKYSQCPKIPTVHPEPQA